MTMRFLIICLCLISLNLYYSVESTTSRKKINLKSFNELPLYIHPLHFISHICRQQKQYSLEITRKYCPLHLQSSKSQEKQQQRGKRVGWTISV
ncbi:unnamed protein product [Adineta steineri]|uniref:Secreted protein n=1 Tax=Adineta steineri TaxID=433720 RepID=A0A814XV36_9BILA|nr:unnamed protein product [Adineta steineri]CAF1221078.1 unnamed protein product [Adineta steineri]CAF3569045.1 unnamed protein product [Adineta steineri]